MHIEFFVEELSASAALENLVPRILGRDVSFAIYPHQGKLDLLAKLPGRLLGYRGWLPEDWWIVVQIDADDQDCHQLKAELEQIARHAGLITKSSVAAGEKFQVLNRIAVEELEAWFFGDVEALNAAYPRVPKNLAERAKYRNPDAIKGGTWEALERELQRHGYHRDKLAKVSAARDISAQMNPEHNRSHSFQVFRQGLLELMR